MNRKIKFLIISIIVIAGIVLGVNYISNAAVIENAFGEEIENIENDLGATVFTKTTRTAMTTKEIVDTINTKFTEYNKLAKPGSYMENYLANNTYFTENLFCIKHNRSLLSYDGQKTSIHHYDDTSQSNMYDLITFEGGVYSYDKTPKLKYGKTAWKTVYDAGTLGCHVGINGITAEIYSNFNAIRYSSYTKLSELSTPEYSLYHNYRVPYILSFQDPNNPSKIEVPSEAQQALWGYLGELSTSCAACHTDCTHYEEMDLHKAGIAVEQYLIEEETNNHGDEPKITVPRGSQAGSAYLNDGSAILNETIAKMEDEMKEALETQSIVSDGIVRIGPFQMSDYAYAFSEHVADYSNKDLEWPHVIAGIVDGEITINGTTIKIVAKDEGSGYVRGSEGTEIEGSADAAIVYKDWYDQVPLKYLQSNASNDVRGDATRGGTKLSLNGKETEILYKPIIDNTSTKPAGVYTTGFTTYGAKELLYGEGSPTKDPLEVMIKDEDGNYTVDYPFPLPLSTFYIEVPVSVCGDAESILTNISFTYRKTEVSGTGDVIVTRAVKSKLTFYESASTDASKVITASEAQPCTVYYCQDQGSCHSYANHPTKSSGGYQSCTHTWSCDTPGAPKDSSHYCPSNHTHSGCGCSGKCDGHQGSCDCNLSANEVCTKDHTYKCSGCICAGNHSCYSYCQCPGYSHTHTAKFLCEHGHEKCTAGHWEVTDSDLSIVYGQPMLRVNYATTRVRENKVDSAVEVRVREDISTKMEIVCVWHGWDSLENRGSSVKDRVNDDGFFDDIEELEWASNKIKAAELGDRIVYRVVVNHTASVPMYIWLRIKYPVDMVADDVTTPEVYQVGPDEFYGDRYEKYSGGWFSPTSSNVEGEETKQYINAKRMTAEGKPRTYSIRTYVKNDASFVFFFEYTLTKEIKTYIENARGKKIANTPTLQITSLDYKWKTVDNPDDSYVNRDFNRACPSYSTGAWKGPVITRIQQQDQPLIVKRYVINVNKYIYDVEHQNDAVTGMDTTISADASRGYKFAEGETNLYSVDTLPTIYQNTETLKQNYPVYVEYGDRITYKIEIGNGKVSNRDTVDDFDYNVDKIYVTLVDELPKKYSNLSVIIEDDSLQGAHLKRSIPAANSDTGGTITLTDLMVPKNGVTTVVVSFDIEEHTKGTIEQNKAYVKDKIVYNYNRGPNATPWTDRTSDVSEHAYIIGESSEWYILNDYEIDIDKYVSSYKSTVHESNETLGFTQETPKINDTGITSNLGGGTQATNEDMQRMDWTDDKKNNDPVQVEKDDQLIYSIKLENLANSIPKGHKKATKNATQVRVSKIKEEMHVGLQYQDVIAYVYSDSGAKLRDITPYVTHNDLGGNKHEFMLDHVMETLLDPNEYMVFYIKVVVTESNMSLEKLYNNAEIVTLSNINAPNTTNANSDDEDARLVKTEPGVHKEVYDENIADQKETSEYVRMKDLVIAGKVWLDKDRDGQMEDEDSSLLTQEEKDRYLSSNNGPGKEGVVVKLYRTDQAEPVRTTVTDANGLYTFSQSNGGWCTNSFDGSGPTYNAGTDYQRIDKATGKDNFGNYTSGSTFIDYYIEYEYDGILYKSTEVYSTGKYPVAEDQGMTNLTGDGNFNDLYKTDSNAYEKKSERERFNQLYEYISYNSAFDINKANDSELEFEKDKHVSLLVEDKGRVVRSRSFINNKTDADNYLWLYDYQGTGATLPNTEYLKYINLGLELREEVDIALTKDVYKVKTTINGESMEYDFNQNAGLNGVNAGLGGTQTGSGEYLNDFVVKKAYGLEIYEYDYKYRVDQYFADEVRNYKGIESELNIEVTYRITVDNKAISDADDVKDDGKDYVTDNKLKVKISEIMDVYETNFIELGARPDDEITIKTKDDNGYLVDTKIKTIEAWYFKEDVKGNYKVVNSTAIGEKPIYIETTTGGTHSKVPLTVSATSAFTDNQISYKDYGYNKLYITGMENEFILEDQDLDIYVKYTLDKDQTTIDVDVDTYEETTSSTTKKFGSVELEGIEGKYEETIVVDKSTGKATMQRSLKINDPVTKKPRTYNRGIENIAQVNAYSVWYMDNKPASLVDRNSNVGNLGANGESPDDITKYDDTTYKTGVEITIGSTEEVTNETGDIVVNGQGQIVTKPVIERIITGKVWDDSRTTSLGSGNEIQYIGDGEYNRLRLKMADALMNENVKLNYNGYGTQVTEERDFPIRNVKAEFIEIVKMPDPSGTGERYYEQVLQQVTWEQVQNTRTERDGTYELSGFIPGTYIVRFTYGDTATGDAEEDMQIFNGQDYKSTQYNPELSDNETDVDKILGIIEKAGKSDARDDERRRLQVNSYSEVMTNAKAEILKGVGNGTALTPNSDSNSATDLKELTDNTYMQAETVEFLVKAEKLTEIQQTFTKYLTLSTKTLGIDEIFYSELQAIQKEERDKREFKITNIDLGIEYRPESEIRLVKEIEEVKLVTEDGNTLVDLFFITEGENENTTHKLDTEKSKGLELVQFITNTYTNELLNRLTNEKKQGFIFVQVDEDILQGCTVQIVYKFEAENNSEVDRIAVNLDEIRYKENPAAIELINAYPKVAAQAADDYTASGIAAKVIESDMYRTVVQDGVEVEYRLRPKTVVTEGLTPEQEKEAYFGRYVGYGYFTGKESNLDTVASLKFDKILDYVDVNLEYKQESEQSSTIDKFWTRVKTNDLKSLLYQVRTSTANPVAELQNGRGYEYKTLIVSVDDRIKDDTYSTRYSSFKVNSQDDNIRNNDLSRFLLPKITVETEAERDKSVATIKLPVSKVLAAETDKDNMSYENLAEIVQFTTLTGRRTNFATTIGNADIEKVAPNESIGTLEFVTAALESDTAATETVTLIPPTGLMKNRLAIVNVVEATSVGVGFIFVLGTIAVILIIIIAAILFVIRKYKKRRII